MSTSDWVVACLAIASLVIGVLQVLATGPGSSARKLGFGICGGLVALALIIGVIGSQSKSQSASTAGSTVPPSAPRQFASSPTNPATSAVAKPSTSAQPAATYLSNLTPLSGGPVPSGPMVLDGNTYANSICFCSPANNYAGGLAFEGQYQTYSFTYPLNKNYTWFNATIGLIDGEGDDATGVVLFTVQVDNDSPIYSGSASIYTTRNVHVSVAGGVQLTLTMEMTKGSNPATSNSAPAWGNASVQ